MAGPIVCKDPTATFTFSDVVVDISDHVKTVEPSTEVEVVDVRTFAAPKAQDFGAETEMITLGLLWSGDLYDALLPYKNVEGAFACNPKGAVNKAIRATVKFGRLPFGPVEHGQPIEADLELIVTDAISYS